MAVNIKMGVDTSGFKQSITDANAQLKTFDAQLKLADATMKATGNSEQGLITKTNALNGKLQTQKQMIQQYEKALKSMKDAGVDPLRKDYQKLETALLNAKAGMIETETALNSLTVSEETAAQTADKLTQSMNGIDKKISLEQVRSGIKSITDGLENAAEMAIQFGEKLFSVIMESAQQADDIGTMAERLGLTEKEIQQINHNAERFEVTAEQLGTTWKKLKKNMASDNKEIVEGFAELRVQTHQIIPGKYENIIGEARDYKDVFWETGDALLHMTDAAKQEELAQKLLGRSWDELIPLFKAGRETYEEALKNAPVASDEAINNLADLNARMAELEASWNTLKLEALGKIAPALEKGADAIANLLDKVTAYLQTDEGQEMMTNLGTAVSGLFDDLSKIDPGKVVEGFTGVFEKVVGGLEWLVGNKENIAHALEWIVGCWATLELTGGALDVLKVIEGAKNLTVGGGGTRTGTETTTETPIVTGAGTGGGVWSKMLNGATLFAAADAMYKATEEQIKKVGEEFRKNTAGMSEKEQLKYVFTTDFQMTSEEADEMIKKLNTGTSGGHDITLPVEFEPELGAIEKLEEKVGVITIPVQYSVSGGGGGGGVFLYDPTMGLGHPKGYANGLPFVPYDGYLALLHRGERVMTATQNKSYTVNNHTYLDNVHLHNALEVDALADRLAQKSRRILSGYGS